MNAPSVKALSAAFPNVPQSEWVRIRSLIHQDRPVKALEAFDIATGGYGVEYIASTADTMRSVKGLEYVNHGETYTTTLIYNHKTRTVVLGSWGDIVERNMAFYN